MLPADTVIVAVFLCFLVSCNPLVTGYVTLQSKELFGGLVLGDGFFPASFVDFSEG